jgi:PAS domain S-box-containing protein
MSSRRILIVEDEAIIAADIARRVADLGYEVAGVCATGEDACRQTAVLQPDLVLMDIVLRGEISGIEAARRIHERQGIPVVYLTSHADNATVDAACATSPNAYLLKPLDVRELRVTLQLVFDRRAADDRLRRVEHWFASTLQSIADAIITTGTDGRVTFLNRQAEEITGWTADDAVQRPLTEVFSVVDHASGAGLPDPTRQAIDHGATIALGPRLALTPRRGGRVFVDTSVAPIRDFHGTIVGSVLVFRDTTRAMLGELEIVQLKERLEQLVAARTAELVAANRELELFTAFASHDLRRPLQNIYANAFLLGSTDHPPTPAEAHQLLQRIQSSALVMGAMLDAFLKLAHSGRNQLERRPIAIREMVEQVMREIDLQGLAPGLRLRYGPIEDTEGDPVLIRQVWANLLSNCAKFASPDRPLIIEVGARQERGRVVYHVRDNGLGFSMAEAARLFHAFQRLESHTGRTNGHGLDLALVRRIVERHGGTVWAEGRPNEGATFYFTLPLPSHGRSAT